MEWKLNLARMAIDEAIQLMIDKASCGHQPAGEFLNSKIGQTCVVYSVVLVVVSQFVGWRSRK